MQKNTLLAKWRDGQASYGCWLQIANTHTAEMLAGAGFDWICVDLQHGLLDYADLRTMLPAIRASQTTTIVRVSTNDPAEIMKVLDVGAMGVIVPMVNNRAEAEAAVAACKYPPAGGRSFGPIRAAMALGQNYVAEANDEVACIVMIETAEGIEKVEEIVSTPGLGGVFIGPADLALALGLPARGDTEDALHMATCAKILETCKRHRVPAGIYTGGLDYAKRRINAGFDFVTLGSDGGFMMAAAHADLAAMRAFLKER